MVLRVGREPSGLRITDGSSRMNLNYRHLDNSQEYPKGIEPGEGVVFRLILRVWNEMILPAGLICHSVSQKAGPLRPSSSALFPSGLIRFQNQQVPFWFIAGRPGIKLEHVLQFYKCRVPEVDHHSISQEKRGKWRSCTIVNHCPWNI